MRWFAGQNKLLSREPFRVDGTLIEAWASTRTSRTDLDAMLYKEGPIAALGKAKLRGLNKVGWAFTFAAAASDRVRLPRLLEAPS